MEWKDIIINGNKTPYRISEYGDVYSLLKNRLLSPGTIGLSPYLYKAYNLGYGNGKRRMFSAHRLVYSMFIGEIPEGMEINHKDMNKYNNHYSNLEIMTHAENMRHARNNNNWQHGTGKGFTHNEETRKKMREAKYKKINVYRNDELLITFSSIEETAQKFRTYRKKIYRALKTGKRIKYKEHSYILKYA